MPGAACHSFANCPVWGGCGELGREIKRHLLDITMYPLCILLTRTAVHQKNNRFAAVHNGGYIHDNSNTTET